VPLALVKVKVRNPITLDAQVVPVTVSKQIKNKNTNKLTLVVNT
jgi:hypothetical protein